MVAERGYGAVSSRMLLDAGLQGRREMMRLGIGLSVLTIDG